MDLASSRWQSLALAGSDSSAAAVPGWADSFWANPFWAKEAALAHRAVPRNWRRPDFIGTIRIQARATAQARPARAVRAGLPAPFAPACPRRSRRSGRAVRAGRAAPFAP